MATSSWNISSSMTASAATPDLLHTQLASALSTMGGDAQYWEESISPASIRQSLATADPSNANSTPVLLKGMKWLLACISKGRNVSDFYPHVVKLVGSPSLDVRKMVYMYLVQYADHDTTTRELSLLSINSFQRGLVDNEQWIRALALRVLSSIRVPDVLPLQLLAVQKAATDKSPYVRKCAANALSKLNTAAAAGDSYSLVLEIMTKLLHHDTSTMVLTSAMVAFLDVCPLRLELLHACFRKLCHLLTDMDEWGQVIVLDTLARYCRTYFSKPASIGSAELIDQQRRVVRQKHEIQTITSNNTALLPTPPSTGNKVKRRIIKKGFYSDEEDDSTEEEVLIAGLGNLSSTAVSALRSQPQKPSTDGMNNDYDYQEDEELHEDHRLLLRSSLPLLKSRNSGVVLAVCSLHYYCGVSSIRVRSLLGKALVRIHRDRREIQYVVLTSIQTLVTECPSAFSPYLHDFFVKAMDPSFTRIIKLDILTALALEPAAIDAVLKELRNYIRHEDELFVCASIRAVGKVVELARIVHDRQGQKSNAVAKERQLANQTALNALYGLMTLTMASTNYAIVGECAIVMRRILQQLQSDNHSTTSKVEDPNRVQELAMKRLVVLLVTCLSLRAKTDENDSEEEEPGSKADDKVSLPSLGLASTMWIVGEWLAGTLAIRVESRPTTKIRVEFLRLIAKCFPSMESCEKTQAVSFACKMLVHSSGDGTNNDATALCELILSMGRVDVQTDVRDRTRHESALLHVAVGLKYDVENLPEKTQEQQLGKAMINMESAKAVFLQPKPPPSALPFDDVSNDATLRFGTLSSLVGYRARAAYLPMPPWANVDSDASLRDAVSSKDAEVDYGWKVQQGKQTTTGRSGFYDSDKDSTSSSDDSSSSSSDDDSEDSSSSSSSSSSDSSSADVDLLPAAATPSRVPDNIMPTPIKAVSLVDASSEEEKSSDSSDSSDDSSDDSDHDTSPAAVAQSVENLLNLTASQPTAKTANDKKVESKNESTSYANGLEGLVMAPVVVTVEPTTDPDIDSSDWFSVVRPELSGGLTVMARYLRGPTKAREAKLMGLFASTTIAMPTNVVLVQIRLEHRGSTNIMVRRIRILPKAGAPKRIVIPPEISELHPGHMAMVILGMEFPVMSSDKDGILSGKFDIRSDRGSHPLEVRPPLGELLQPCHVTNVEFDRALSRSQGFDRVTWSFAATLATDSLVTKLLKQASLTKQSTQWKDHKFHLVGALPVSGEVVFVVVTVDDFKRGELMVCCDNVLATNSILELLKKGVS